MILIWGYAKYADIARLYGWDALTNFYHNQQLKCVENNECNAKINQGVDDRTLELSIAAGYDLTALIHLWGSSLRSWIFKTRNVGTQISSFKFVKGESFLVCLNYLANFK